VATRDGNECRRTRVAASYAGVVIARARRRKELVLASGAERDNAAMATALAATERGPVGRTRSIPLSILWAILTLGIYTLVWTYRTQEEVKRYSGNGIGGVLGLVVYILISPVTFFVIPSEVRYMYEDLDGQRSPVRGIYGLWFLLPLVGHLIWFVQVQGALNRYWESKGAPAA
jgi:Domain of unknown function (DUF4234)